MVWDVDDVLNPLTRSWLANYRKSHPETVSYEQLSENPPHQILGVAASTYLASLDEFRLGGLYADLKPDRDVMAWFQQCGAQYRHIALTAAPRRAAAVSAEWVTRHYGDWIRLFSFVPSRREGDSLPVYDASKAEFLSWLGRGDIFIDDSTTNIEAVAAIGLRTILVPQPWNRGGVPLKVALQELVKAEGAV